MSQHTTTVKRIVVAPAGTGPMFAGEMLSVELGPTEDVEWLWSHDAARGSVVTGYTIVPRAPEHEIASP